MRDFSKLIQFLFKTLIRMYQLILSPLWPQKCRFLPTCSQYALEALTHHGLSKGLFLSLKRIGRCHPWGGHGLDPVPLSREG